MNTYTKNKLPRVSACDPVGPIATCLASEFAKALFNSYTVKNYSNYVKCLKEILKWSQEFYDLYYNNEKDWEISESTKNSIYNNGVHREDFLIAWGNNRMKQFFVQRQIKI